MNPTLKELEEHLKGKVTVKKERLEQTIMMDLGYLRQLTDIRALSQRVLDDLAYKLGHAIIKQIQEKGPLYVELRLVREADQQDRHLDRLSLMAQLGSIQLLKQTEREEDDIRSKPLHPSTGDHNAKKIQGGSELHDLLGAKRAARLLSRRAQLSNSTDTDRGEHNPEPSV